MPADYGSVGSLRAPRGGVEFSRRSLMFKAALVVSAVLLASVLAVGALLAPGIFADGQRQGRTALVSVAGAESDFVSPPFASELGRSRRARPASGFALPPADMGQRARTGRTRQKSLRSSLSAAVPPAWGVLPPPATPLYAHAPFRKVPPTKDYEHVRYHKVPGGEVAYYGDKRYGPWFAEHKHGDDGEEEDAEDNGGEINVYPSDCTSGCDLKQSRMLEAAEGMVRVAFDTHKSREAAYKEQVTRNKLWAKRMYKLLEKIVPPKAAGVCHKTVDCDDCAGIKEEKKCKQKLGIWVPHVHVMEEANKEASADKTELNKEVLAKFRARFCRQPPCVHACQCLRAVS